MYVLVPRDAFRKQFATTSDTVCCRVASKGLVFHRKLWPAVMELTNGKPKLKGGQMIVDDPKLGIGHVTGNGGHLHCAREDWGPESASFQVVQGQIRANDFIVFICALPVCSSPSSLCVCARVRACACVGALLNAYV